MRKFLILLAILLVSCSPQKRLNRIVSNHPELAAAKKSVTVTVHDTIYIEAQKDTVYIPDTIYLQAKNGSVIAEAQAGNAKAKIIKTTDGLNLAIEQVPDTIPITSTANVDVPEVQVKRSGSTLLLSITVLLVVLIVLIIKIFE